ncbi:MAG: NADH-quinone oxidoreductase subunit J [Firmicutes bacterium]|nr:NADH-quinone oxidoreductase subunit J [Bacillota bacterium]
MDLSRVTFLTLAALATVSAFRVVTASKIMHAALWLGFTFLMVAGVFLTMGAEFLAAAQVLIYVGAVTTIILFGIMLSEAAEVRGGRDPVAPTTPKGPAIIRRFILPIVATLAFAAIMIFVYSQAPWPDASAAPAGDTVRLLGSALFTDYVVPFELAAVLLLVALVGAIAIAVRDDHKEEQG